MELYSNDMANFTIETVKLFCNLYWFNRIFSDLKLFSEDKNSARSKIMEYDDETTILRRFEIRLIHYVLISDRARFRFCAFKIWMG